MKTLLSVLKSKWSLVIILALAGLFASSSVGDQIVQVIISVLGQ